jgi:hypothetical protein
VVVSDICRNVACLTLADDLRLLSLLQHGLVFPLGSVSD